MIDKENTEMTRLKKKNKTQMANKCGAAHFWKKPFGKCNPKKALPQDCFNVEGIDSALEEIHD